MLPVGQLRFAWSPPEWVVATSLCQSAGRYPPPHGILKAGVWCRRGRLLMVSPDSRVTASPLSGRNSTYRPVHISGTGSYMWPRRGPASKYPPAEPGALGSGPLEAAVGVADAAPILLGHLKVADQRHRFIWSRRLSSCSCFLMYSRITASCPPPRPTTEPPGPNGSSPQT